MGEKMIKEKTFDEKKTELKNIIEKSPIPVVNVVEEDPSSEIKWRSFTIRAENTVTGPFRALQLNPYKQIRLGELLEEKGKDIDKIVAEHITDSYNFQKMEDIEYIFEEYFKIDILEGEKQTFEKLFQIRHILVHNSGIIDKDFLSKVKTDQKEKTMIKLDKKEVNKWILSVCKFINKLEDQLDSKFGFHACLVDPEPIMPFLALELRD
jgi:hypothetical protein